VRALLRPAADPVDASGDRAPVRGEGGEPEGLSPRWARRLSWGALALVLVPLVVSAVTAVQDLDGSYYPAGDLASIELKTQDVLRHPVLTGLFSRDGWDHPGPAMFYVLAVPYRLLGSHTWGLHIGALLVNAASIVGMALIARRRGGTPLLLLTLVGIALLAGGLGPDFLRDPWNPFLPVLPFGLLVFLAWEMACGSTWALPVAAGVCSFCVQTHIGYGLLALPVLVWGVGALVLGWRRRGTPTSRQLAGPAVVAGLVLLVMWLPPLIEQLQPSSGGNLQAITDYFTGDEGQEHHSLTEGYRLLSGQLEWPPQWVVGWPERDVFSEEPTLLTRAAVPVLLAPLIAGVVLLWRLRVPNSRSYLLLMGLVLGLGVFWVARTLGPVFNYRVAWISVVGLILFLPAAWGLWVLLARRFDGLASRVLTGLALSALAALGFQGVVDATAEPVTAYQEPWSDVLAATVPDVVRGLPPGDGDVLMRCDGDPGCIVSAGLFLELEERGLRPRVEAAYGVISSNADHRVHDDGPVRAVLHVGYGERFDRVMAREGAELVAYDGPLPPREAARTAARIRRVDEQYDRGEIDDVERYLLRVELTQQLGQPVGVFLEPE
jgi:hypothetical protein